MELTDIIGKFQLNLLPANWVQTTWLDDFSGPLELPAEYELQVEEVDFCQLMEEFNIFIKNWLVSEDLEDYPANESLDRSTVVRRKSWQSLINTVNHRALLCFMGTFILKDPAQLKDIDSIKVALTAVRLYFALLSIHGSHIYHVFNASLYGHAIEVLKVSNLLNPSTKHSSKGKGKKRANKAPEEEQESEEETPDDNYTIPTFNINEKRNLINYISLVLEELLYCLNTLHFKDQEDSLRQTVQVLTILTKLERSSSNILGRPPPKCTMTYIAYKSYDILRLLCEKMHGDPENNVRIIMTFFLPILCENERSSMQSIGKDEAIAQNHIRNHLTSFIHKLLNELKDCSYLGVMALVQQLCVRIPDKADIRSKCVQNIAEMLKLFPYKIYKTIVLWIISLCHADNIKYRITGVEIIIKLLNAEERTEGSVSRTSEESHNVSSVNGDISPISNEEQIEYSDHMSHELLFAVIFSRCHDVSPTVRAKALSALGTLITSRNGNHISMMENIFIIPYMSEAHIDCNTGLKKGFFDFKTFIKSPPDVNTKVDPLPLGVDVLGLLDKLVDDDKVYVRKNALQALSNICQLSTKWMTSKRLGILVTACKDLSVAVRKMLVVSLTDLLISFPTHDKLPKCWVQGVIPLIADNEIKSQEKVMEVVETTILNNIVNYKDMTEALHNLPWILLNIISDLEMRCLFRFVCKQWTDKNRIKGHLIKTVQSHIGTKNNLAAWFLIVCISEFQNIVNPKFILDYYFENVHEKADEDEYCSQLVLEAVHLNWRELQKPLQVELCDKLRDSVENFRVPLPLIARSIDICQLQDLSMSKEWAKNLIMSCEEYLITTIAPGCKKKVPSQRLLIQYIFTLGEATQILPDRIEKSTIRMLAQLIDKQYDEKNTAWQGTASDEVQAVAIVTLGKLSLQDQFVAKSIVPSLGKLLRNRGHSSIKINAMVALTDLCVRFTSLVEAYLGEMCVCLKEPDLAVRTNTLTLLMQLLQEDYLKLRCPIFYYILIMLEDEANSIREQTSAFLVNTVLSKQPNIMCQQFLQALFFFNDFQGNSTYSKVGMSPQEKQAFCMAGEGKEESRYKLYRFMLDHMEDDHRFKVSYRLCTEVLDQVSEGEIKLDKIGTSVLKDALHVLASDEIRLVNLRSSKEDDGSEISEVVTYTKKAIISQLVKKNYIENIIPIIIKLKHKLLELKSSLVRDLMVCLRELMKDFKDEMQEMLSADKELMTEVMMDMKRVEEEEGVEEEEEEIQGEYMLHIIKEARIECERLSEDILQQGGINIADLSPTQQAHKTPPRTENDRLNLSVASPASSSGVSSLIETPPRLNSLKEARVKCERISECVLIHGGLISNVLPEKGFSSYFYVQPRCSPQANSPGELPESEARSKKRNSQRGSRSPRSSPCDSNSSQTNNSQNNSTPSSSTKEDSPTQEDLKEGSSRKKRGRKRSSRDS